uniref:Uncharacterized protein n=1 Tax=Opuntia streptacantha TaxID=393608 RepID=A0A7C8ZWL7_OPUST
MDSKSQYKCSTCAPMSLPSLELVSPSSSSSSSKPDSSGISTIKLFLLNSFNLLLTSFVMKSSSSSSTSGEASTATDFPVGLPFPLFGSSGCGTGFSSKSFSRFGLRTFLNFLILKKSIAQYLTTIQTTISQT